MAVCPRCESSLVDSEASLSCPRCHGVFVFRAHVDAFLANLGELGESFSYRESARPPASSQQGAFDPDVRYLACPVCGKRMNRRNMRRSGAIVDTCLFHGTWFDAGEAAKVAAIKEDA